MKNTSLALGSFLAVLLASGAASAATHNFTATMNGAQEAPTPITTMATGTATVTFDDVTGKVSGTINFQDLHLANDTVTQMCQAAHIHTGAVGVAGTNIVDFTCAPSQIVFADKTVPPGEVANLLAGNTYVNVHSNKYAGGEIRGQLIQATADAGTDSGGADSGKDAGKDAGSSSGSSGSSGASGTSGGTSGTSGGTSGTSGTAPASSSSDDGGCSTSGTSSNGAALAMSGLVGLALAFRLRARKKR